MTLAVPPDDGRRRCSISPAAGEVEATDLGEFTDDGFFDVTWGDETVGLLEMDFLHEGDARDASSRRAGRHPRFAEPERRADDPGRRSWATCWRGST